MAEWIWYFVALPMGLLVAALIASLPAGPRPAPTAAVRLEIPRTIRSKSLRALMLKVELERQATLAAVRRG